MGRARTITRRSVLVASTAVLGGVAFGTYLVAKPHDNPLLDGLQDGEAAFTPFIRITSDTITLIVPHFDGGQGVHSAQAALIAEELDVTLDQVTLSFGQPDKAYYNTAIAAEAVPFQSFDRSLPAQSLRAIMGAAIKVLGVQITGGSSTIPDSYDKLRLAGAVARETLKRAAAQRTGTPLANLTTKNGAVHLPDGTAIPYTTLAARAATLDPVSHVTLRDPAQWRLIGRPMQRTDILAKSTGTQHYGIDQHLPGMVHAAIRVSPRRGPLGSHDTTAAEQMRGVQRILPVTNGLAVIADNTWRAFQAANAITCDWAPAPYPAEQADHWAEVANSFTPDRLDAEWRHDGDVPAALADTETIEAEYRAPYVAHAPLEPLNCLIRAGDDSAEIWVGHQVPGFVVQKVAAILGCPPGNVTLHNQFSGGAFGHRLEFENVTLAAEIAAQMRGTPVKLTFSREGDFALDFPRQIGMSRSRGRVKDGQVNAWSLDIATVSASASQSGRLGQPMPGPDAQIPAGAWNMPYAIPNLRVRAYRVPELAPTSSWRSVGASSAGFFAESFLDELIHAAGADPMEERLRLVNHPVHRKVLEAVGDLSDWGMTMARGQGRGLAMVESFGVPMALVVDVTDTEAGIRIDRVFAACDVGRIIDPVNFKAQVSGGIIWGLGHAINSEITYADGMAQQTNYHVHSGMRLHQCPEIFVRGLENAAQIRGVGEPGVPPAPPALANAIFAATGQRLREMPFHKFIGFA